MGPNLELQLLLKVKIELAIPTLFSKQKKLKEMVCLTPKCPSLSKCVFPMIKVNGLIVIPNKAKENSKFNHIDV